MKTFPANFTPDNLEEFKKQLYDRKLLYFRQAIFEYILVTQTEKDKEQKLKAEYDEKSDNKKDGGKEGEGLKGIKKNRPIRERYTDRRDGFNLKQPILGISKTDLGEIEESMIKIVIAELEEKGWKCKIGVGNTFLFICGPSEEPEGIESTLLF